MPSLNEQTVELFLTEGLHLRFNRDYPVSTFQLFTLTWVLSAMLNGKPIRCKGFLPGINLHIRTELPVIERFPTLAEAYWVVVRDRLAEWIELSETQPKMALQLPLSDAEVYTEAATIQPYCTVEIEKMYFDYASTQA